MWLSSSSSFSKPHSLRCFHFGNCFWTMFLAKARMVRTAPNLEPVAADCGIYEIESKQSVKTYPFQFPPLPFRFRYNVQNFQLWFESLCHERANPLSALVRVGSGLANVKNKSHFWSLRLSDITSSTRYGIIQSVNANCISPVQVFLSENAGRATHTRPASPLRTETNRRRSPNRNPAQDAHRSGSYPPPARIAVRQGGRSLPTIPCGTDESPVGTC